MLFKIKKKLFNLFTNIQLGIVFYVLNTPNKIKLYQDK